MILRRLLPAALVAGLIVGTGGRVLGAAASASSQDQNHVHSILVLPRNSNVIYMGAHYHLYRSTDGGRKWHALMKQMVLSLTVDPAHPTRLFCVSLQGGFLTSIDGGVHWNAPHARPPKGQVTGVVYDAATHTLYSYGSGIYRSTDGGKHWTSTLRNESLSTIAIGSGGTAYAASGNGLYVTHDSGKHWSANAAIGSQPIVQVGASGHVAYAVGPISLLKSTNDGRNWKELSKAPSGIEFIGVSPTNPNEVFGEISRQGFYVTHDGGSSWQTANSGIRDRNFSASTVRVAPSSPNIAYTGAWGLNFYATHDGGKHWQRTASLKT